MRSMAGVGVETINPELPVHLAGYGARKGPAESQHDDLTVRVLAVSEPDGSNLVALVLFDLLSMRDSFSLAVRDAVAASLGIAREAVLTSCVHTHGAPSCLPGAEVLGWHVQQGYLEVLVSAAARAAAVARDAVAPCELVHVRFSLPEGTGMNRRRRPWDPSASALRLVGDDGSTIATVGAFGLHPVVHGPEHRVVSTDWVGPFREALEERFGGVGLFVQGCEGDVNPAVTSWESSAEEALAAAASLGRSLASAVGDALESGAAAPVGGSGIRVWSRSVSVPVATTMYSVLSKLDSRLDLELVEWAFGDLHLVGVPGEATQGFQQAVEAARDHPVVFVGLAPTAHGYYPSPFRFGYEEAMSLGRTATRILESALCDGPEAPIAHPAAAPAVSADVRRIDTRTGRIEFASVGDEGAPAVLMIHGTPGSWRQALPLAKDLAEVHRVVLPSRPGYGRTPLDTGRTPSQQAVAYAALLDALGIERAAVIGISGGGPSAAAFAQLFPDRCVGLVLACALAPHLMPIPRQMAVLRRLPVVPSVLSAAQRWQGRRALLDEAAVGAALDAELTAAERAWAAEDPSIRRGLVSFRRSHLDAPAGLDGLRNDIDNMAAARRDGAPATDAIVAPTLVLHGDEDPTVPLDHGRWWASAIGPAQLQVIEGAGHVFLLTRRGLVMPTIASALVSVFAAVEG